MAFSIQSIGRSSPKSNNALKPKPDLNTSSSNKSEKSQRSHYRYYQVKADPQASKASIAYKAIANVNNLKPYDSIAGFDAFV